MVHIFKYIFIYTLFLITFVANANDELSQIVAQKCSQSKIKEKQLVGSAACIKPIAESHPTNGKINNAFKDITNATNAATTNQMYDEVADMKMQKTMTAFLVNASVYGVDGKTYDFTTKNPNAVKDAIALFKKINPNFAHYPASRLGKNIGLAVNSYRKMTKNQTPKKFNSAVFNEKLKKLNSYCSDMNRKYKSYYKNNAKNDYNEFIKDSHLDSSGNSQNNSKSYKNMTSKDLYGSVDLQNHVDSYQNQNVSRANQNALRNMNEHANLASLKTEPQFQQGLRELLDSECGGIVLTEHFTKNVGNLRSDFIRQTCQSGDGVLFHTEDQKQLYLAADELKKKVNDELKESSEDLLVKNPAMQAAKLKEFMNDNPLVLDSILNKENDPAAYEQACKLAKDCLFEEKAKKVVKTAGFVAANIALGAVTGGIGPSIVLGLGMSGIETLYDRHQINESERKTQLLAVTGQTDRVKASEKIGNLEKEKEDQVGSFVKGGAIDAGTQLLTHGLSKALKGSGEITKDVEKVAGESKFIGTTEKQSKYKFLVDDGKESVATSANKTNSTITESSPTLTKDTKIDYGSDPTRNTKEILPKSDGSRLNKISAALEKQETGLTKKTKILASNEHLDDVSGNVANGMQNNARAGAEFTTSIREKGVKGKAITLPESSLKTGEASLEAKHELRHWKFDNIRTKGGETAFDAKLTARMPGASISEYHNGAYSGFQSLEEVSTYSKDLSTIVKRPPKGVTELNTNDLNIREFEDHAFTLKEISEQTLTTKKPVLGAIEDFKTGNKKFTDIDSKIDIHHLNEVPEVRIKIDDKYSMEVKMPTVEDKAKFKEYQDVVSKLNSHENSFFKSKLEPSELSKLKSQQKELEGYFVNRAESKLNDSYSRTKETYSKLKDAVEASELIASKTTVSVKEYNDFVDKVRKVSSVPMKSPSKAGIIVESKVVSNVESKVESEVVAEIRPTKEIAEMSIAEKQEMKEQITKDWKKLTDKEIDLNEERKTIQQKLDGTYKNPNENKYKNELTNLEKNKNNVQQNINSIDGNMAILDHNKNLTIGQKFEQKAALAKQKEALHTELKNLDKNKAELEYRMQAEMKHDPEHLQTRLKSIDEELGTIQTKGAEYSTRLKETELSDQQRNIVAHQDDLSEVERLEQKLKEQKEELINKRSSLLFKNESIQNAKLRNANAESEAYKYEYFVKNDKGKWVSPQRKQNVVSAMNNERETVQHFEKLEANIPELQSEIETTTRKLKEAKLKRANQYFNEGLNENQQKAFDTFKKEINFENMNVADKEDLLLKMHTIHERNNGVNKVLIVKKRDLVELQDELTNRLVDAGKDPKVANKIAKQQVRSLASKENKILGANPLQYEQKYTDDMLADLKKEFKTNPTSAVDIKNEYLELLNKRTMLLNESTSSSSAKKALKEVDKDISNIETVYPTKAELDQIKYDYKNGKMAEAQAKAQARESERVANETKDRTLKEAQAKAKDEAKKLEQQKQNQENINQFQAKNQSYEQVKSNANAQDMQAWSQQMKENGVVPNPNEMDQFVVDAQKFLKTSKGNARSETAENVVDILTRSTSVRKSTDVNSFNSFVEMIKDPKMPSQSKIVAAMERQYDFKKIGSKLSSNQLSDLRSAAEYSRDEDTRNAIKDILIKMDKYYNQ